MTIVLPSVPNFTTCRFFLQPNTQTFMSPLTRTTQRGRLAGSRWNLTTSLPSMKRAQAAPWKAFFALCEGSLNPFSAFDPDCKTPLAGLPGGTPLVNSGSQTGYSLTIDGCTPSALFLKAGDYFRVNGELKIMTADAIADGSGNATLAFMPALRASPADNTPIITNAPTCTMVLTDDMQAAWCLGTKFKWNLAARFCVSSQTARDAPWGTPPQE